MTTFSRIIGFLLLTLFILVTSCSSDDDAQVVLPEPTGLQTTAELATYFESILDSQQVPGFAISIAANNGIVYQEAFGYENIQAQKDFTNETVINIASVSKTFVAAATAKSIEQGYLTMDTPINDILPVEIVNLENPDAIIRVRHLVTHTSGIVDDPNTYLEANYFVLPNQDLGTTGANILTDGLNLDVSEPIDLDDYLSEYFIEGGALYGSSNFIDADPGQVWSYSNVATALMGLVIEVATDMDFAEYVKAYVLQPLQMNASTFDVLEVDQQVQAVPYLDNNTPLPFYGNHGYPEGSIHTTNLDLGRYLLDMTMGVKGQSSTLFGSAYYELLFTEQLPVGKVPSSFADNHGMYWYNQSGSWIHGGNSLGVSSHLEIKEDGSSGFFIISNMDGTFSENEPKWEAVKTLLVQGIEEFISNN
nr:serine hydrolase domain-containing protein [uncultured Allomuricauda sp.]